MKLLFRLDPATLCPDDCLACTEVALAVRGFVAQNEREMARKQVVEWLKQLKY